MTKQVLAITTCRVSTPDQELNHSLERQAEAVIEAAKAIPAVIPDDGQWSGSVSSKSGTNTNRKDLKEMFDYCKKHPQVKYLIVHEVDRFMRSVDELFYFEVRFREEVGVKIIYASQPELNTDNHNSKLLKALEAFKGEGSNAERIKKSIDGQTSALRQGRYPFAPKPGYKKGSEAGVQEIHPIRGPILRDTLLSICAGRLTPTKALIEFNKSDFTSNHSIYKMDKFRKIVVDPFNAGIVEINKQVKVRNENGRHKPLITIEQHYELIRIMDGKEKTQIGPRLNGNSKYPLSNHVTHDSCLDSNICRFVGFDHTNGKKNSHIVYEKYRCRACGMYISRSELHEKIEEQFRNNPINNEGIKDLMKALDAVWKKNEGQAKQDVFRLQQNVKSLNHTINQQVDAATNPENATIKDEILAAIAAKKAKVAELEKEVYELENAENINKDDFLRFAFDFTSNMGSRFLEISPDDRLRCKQIIFPAGFYMDSEQKVYTPQISPLIRLASNKKDTEVSKNSLLVRVTGL